VFYIIIIIREFELLKGLNHEGIVKYYDLIETDYLDEEGSESTCSSAPSSPLKSSTSSTTSSSLASYSSAGMKDGKIYLVMEWLGDGCNLTHWIQQEKNPRRRNIKGILKRLLEAIQYLQEHEITHHDIKLDNIIYDSLTGSVKIIDFGVSEHCPRDESYSAFGTPAYQAPELFTKPSPCDEKYFVSGHKLDVWAVGVVAYQLANEEGALPFDGDSLMEIFDTIIHRDPNWHLLKQNSNNNDLKDLISSKCNRIIRHLLMLLELLNKNPNERLSVKEALNHAYFKSSSTDNNQPSIKNIIKSIFNRLVK